ncbi:solute carrier family 43 member 3b [Tachysurus fulvidraco]|uniref:solute carrier family 43 member 3b n=1 Tax=Tachysurus fulvidraco TaxID=1234273 RepID=UPI000F4E1CA9|nr:solute carrier family 43 member 3b [Tachysurus fulvidraco]XP_027010470.1 solute carrier family 43 member 3b [Tachysurus fulvidraco]XP_027010471.1 solute carrier family 43 member 3b [Tachysurus fulvidraco]
MVATGTKVCYWLTLVSGLVECLCFAGILFGWASLVFVLKSDGYFSYLCVNSTVNENITKECAKQDEQLSVIFTVASFMNNFLTLPNGFVFDYFGTMVTRLLGISIYTTGTLMIAFSNAALSVILYPALALIAVGGILFLITNMQVGNLFGSHRSTVITLYNGAFDSSSAVFLIVKLLYEDGVSLRYSLIFLSCCSVIHIIRTFLLMPRSHIPFPLPENYTYGLRCGNAQTSSESEKVSGKDNIKNYEATETPANTDKSTNTNNPVTSERSFKSCILSWFFLWHLLWLSIMQLRHYLFIGTLNPFLNHLTAGVPSLVSTYTNAFAFTQLCGILCAPWNGLIMDRNKNKPREKGQSESEADLNAAILSLFVTVVQCVFFSLCAAIPVLPLQYLTFVLQVLNRSFLYGGNAAFISVAFPPAHFGKLYGTFMALSAVVSLLQYPCFEIINGPLNGDPFAVNVALTILSCLAFIHPIYVYMHCRRQAAQRAKAENTS